MNHIRGLSRVFHSSQLQQCRKLTYSVSRKLVRPGGWLFKNELHPSTSVAINKRNYSYEGDGKTTVTVLNQEENELILVNTYSNAGFRLINGIFLMGPVALFPKTVFQWDVNSVADVNEDALSLFWLVEPRIDVLIIGVGDNYLTIDPKLRLFMSRKGINMEVLATDKAVATFNFLNSDRRNVAAALIPPTRTDYTGETDDDMFLLQAQHRTLFRDKKIDAMHVKQGYDEMLVEIEKERKWLEDRERNKEKYSKPPR